MSVNVLDPVFSDLQPTVNSSTVNRYTVRVSQATTDPAWDSFLAKTAGGHHVQSSLWAQLKASLGWRAVRIMLVQQEEIVGGAQLLLRPLPLLGAVGHLPKGPVVSRDDPTLRVRVLDEVQRVARRHWVQYLLVQPPNNGAALVAELPARGFQPSTARSMPTASVLIDLTQPLENILARMKKNTRYGVRRSAKDGITVRPGTIADLPTFHRLLTATSERQGFLPFAMGYFQAMWRIFAPHGHLHLLIAEYAGEAIAGQLLIAFGDTVYVKQFGWSGRHGERRPSEAVEWASIVWAKEQGYRYLDLEGIHPDGARAFLQGQPLPAGLEQTPTSYKLGFGGEVRLFPEAYELLCNPLLRQAYTTIFPQISHWPVVKSALDRFRTR